MGLLTWLSSAAMKRIRRVQGAEVLVVDIERRRGGGVKCGEREVVRKGKEGPTIPPSRPGG